jgi:hypothetical protein
MRTGTGKPKLRLRAIVIAGLLSVGLVGALLAQTVQKVSPVLVFTCSAGSFASALAGTGIFTCTAAPSSSGNNTWSGTNTFGTVIGTVTTQSGTTYTLAAADCGTTVKFTNSSPVAVTVPSSLVVGCNIALLQTTAGGQVTVSAGGGATFAANPHSFTKTFGQNSYLGVSVFSTSTFTVTGDGA